MPPSALSGRICTITGRRKRHEQVISGRSGKTEYVRFGRDGDGAEGSLGAVCSSSVIDGVLIPEEEEASI